MSEATLNSLLEYLYGALSPDNMLWVAKHLAEHAKNKIEPMKPYTMEEIDAMIDESEAEIAAGLCQDNEDVFHELQDELEQEELALAYSKAV